MRVGCYTVITVDSATRCCIALMVGYICRFKDRLVDEGFNPAYGARPLRRAIQRLLEDALAERMLGGDIAEGDSDIMDVDAEGNITVLNLSLIHI